MYKQEHEKEVESMNLSELKGKIIQVDWRIKEVL